MNTPHFRIKFSAIGAPVLILLYGFLRLIDLSDGNLSHGFFWNSGHVFFFIAFVLFGFLNIELSRLFSRYNKPTQLTAFLFLAVSLSGTVCFLWGILGDLFHNVAPVPGPL